MAHTRRKSKKTAMCGCHGRFGLGKLKSFRKQSSGILTAESDSVDAIYDMMPSAAYGNNQAYDLWRTTPSGRQRLAQDVYYSDARRFATINEAHLTRGGLKGAGLADMPWWGWIGAGAVVYFVGRAFLGSFSMGNR